MKLDPLPTQEGVAKKGGKSSSRVFQTLNGQTWDRGEAKASCQLKRRKTKKETGGRTKKTNIITAVPANIDGIAVKQRPLAHTKRGSQMGGGGWLRGFQIFNGQMWVKDGSKRTVMGSWCSQSHLPTPKSETTKKERGEGTQKRVSLQII